MRTLFVALALCACARPLDVPARALTLETELCARVRAWVAAGELARDDGYVYAVDVGQLLVYAARAGERELYAALREHCVRHMIIDLPDDPYTRGFVLWRQRADEPPDASGTTEALRVAEGLWRGALAFGDARDRELALTVLRGYARHAWVERGVWLVRNYFKLETRAFATNSFLVDYAPDFVAEVARAEGDEELEQLAERSAALVRRARTPCGLVYDLVQPEVATLLPEELAIFSPNDVVQVANAATTALHASASAPDVARALLAFARARGADLHMCHRGTSGEAYGARRPGVETWAVLTRLAVGLRDAQALDVLAPELVSGAAAFARRSGDPRLYVASEVLLALEALRRAR